MLAGEYRGEWFTCDCLIQQYILALDSLSFNLVLVRSNVSSKMQKQLCENKNMKMCDI